MESKRLNMDSIHKTAVIVLVFGVVKVGVTKDIHTKLADD